MRCEVVDGYATKLLGSGFRRRNKEEDSQEAKSTSVKGEGRKDNNTKKPGEEPDASTVLFVEQTRGGELAKRIREQVRRLQPILGFNLKVVERAGGTLKSKFPLGGL